MAGELRYVFATQHPRLCAEVIPEFSVVQAGRSSHDDQYCGRACLNANSLCDLHWLDTVGRRGESNRGGALRGDDDFYVGGVTGEKLADGFEAHVE
jgi:hypothetical protein